MKVFLKICFFVLASVFVFSSFSDQGFAVQTDGLSVALGLHSSTIQGQSLPNMGSATKNIIGGTPYLLNIDYCKNLGSFFSLLGGVNWVNGTTPVITSPTFWGPVSVLSYYLGGRLITGGNTGWLKSMYLSGAVNTTHWIADLPNGPVTSSDPINDGSGYQFGIGGYLYPWGDDATPIVAELGYMSLGGQYHNSPVTITGAYLKCGLVF